MASARKLGLDFEVKRSIWNDKLLKLLAEAKKNNKSGVKVIVTGRYGVYLRGILTKAGYKFSFRKDRSSLDWILNIAL